MKNNYKKILNYKRIVDFIISLFLICIFSPIMLAIAVLILIFDGQPIVYSQKRVGMNFKIFTIFKFRTMSHRSHAVRDGLQVGASDPRITKLGRMLRKSSLDELPQLFNMLSGDLSLVGPRACLPEQISYFNSKHRARFTVRPGITGLAIIKGRASIPWSRRLRWDRVYIKRRNFNLDLYIIFKTISVVFAGSNVYYDHEKKGPAFDLASSENLPQSVDWEGRK